MKIVKGIDIETYTQDKVELKWIEVGLKAYDKVDDMKKIFTNLGPKPIIAHLQRLWKLYKKDGIDDVNRWSMKLELYHFVGDRVENNSELDEEVNSIVAFIKKYAVKKESLAPVKQKGK